MCNQPGRGQGDPEPCLGPGTQPPLSGSRSAHPQSDRYTLGISDHVVLRDGVTSRPSTQSARDTPGAGGSEKVAGHLPAPTLTSRAHTRSTPPLDCQPLPPAHPHPGRCWGQGHEQGSRTAGCQRRCADQQNRDTNGPMTQKLQLEHMGPCSGTSPESPLPAPPLPNCPSPVS